MKRLLLASLVLLTSLDAAQAQSVTDAELLTKSVSGEAGNAATTNASVSPNGRPLAFASLATNLVPGDIENTSNVFSSEVVGGVVTTKLLVTNTSGGFPNQDASEVRVSAMHPDGRRYAVVYTSAATDLVNGYPTGQQTPQVFVSFLPRGEVILVTRKLSGPNAGNVELSPSSGVASSPSIAIRSVEPGELRVAFLSNATDLGPDAQNPSGDNMPFVATVKKRDGKPGWDVSIRAVPPASPSLDHSNLSLSGDGRTVVYECPKQSVSGGNNIRQVFRVKEGSTTPELISAYAFENNFEALEPTVSFNGDVVAFLMRRDQGVSAVPDLYYARTGDNFAARPNQANTNSAGVASTGNIAEYFTSSDLRPRAQLAPNGIFVAFSDTGQNLTESGTGFYSEAQTYVKNLVTGQIVRTSAKASSGISRGQNGDSYGVAIGGSFFNGNSVTATFLSTANNLGDNPEFQAQAYRAVVTFDPPALTQGAPIDAPPDVRVSGDRATIRLQEFSSAAAPGGGPASIQANRVRYSTTIRENSTRKRIQLVTAKNRVTVRKLSPGRYTVRYRVSSPAPGGGTLTSKYSPKQPMTIN